MKNNSIVKSLFLAKANAKRTMMALLLGFASFSLAVGGMSSTATAQTDSSRNIEGTWLFTITPSPDSGAVPFTAVASFTAGGVFLATGSNDRLNPVSPLYGSWEQIGHNRFGSTTHMFAFDPTGNPLALLKTNQVFQVTKRNELMGIANLSVCDLHGENCTPLPGVSQVTGKRVKIEKLEIH